MAIWPYKGEALVSPENLQCLEKSVHHLYNYAMKTILSDAQLREEHNETKYSPIDMTDKDRIMDLFVPGYR